MDSQISRYAARREPLDAPLSNRGVWIRPLARPGDPEGRSPGRFNLCKTGAAEKGHSDSARQAKSFLDHPPTTEAALISLTDIF